MIVDLKLARSVWSFLVIGIALRCVALDQPLIDAHLIRQCQTAAVTQSLTTEPGFHSSARITWLGDLDARYILELPLYNYLVIAAHKVINQFDVSGKVVSIILWGCGFLVLQSIWRRLLTPEQAFWANLLFVVAPLSVFFGQAFMPEMLVQFLAFSLIVLALRYDEEPSLPRWIFCAAVGLLALLVKFPEIAHLYVFVGFLVYRREKWKAVLRPRYWIALMVAALAIKWWGNYMDSVNTVYLPEWTTRGNLHEFAGTISDRFQIRPWLMICLYVGAFIVPGPALIVSLYGFGVWFSNRHAMVGAWLVALAAFYLVWFGNAGPAGQSYYNLPALGPLCALFGIGMQALAKKQWMGRWHRVIAGGSVAVLLVVSAIPAAQYLFRQDRQLLSAAMWVRRNTDPGDILLFRLAHRPDMIHYRNNPVPAYYSQRATFVWTEGISDAVAAAALGHSRYAIVTLPHDSPSRTSLLLRRLRGTAKLEPPSRDWLGQNGFRQILDQTEFLVFAKD